MALSIEKLKEITPKNSRYEKQLRRIQKIHSTSCIESAVNGAISNIKEAKSKAFVIYGEPQSGKTEMMICLTAKLLDEGHKIIILLLNDNVELLNQNFKRFCYSGINPAPRKYDQILDPSIKIGNDQWIIFCKKNSRNLQDLIEKIGYKKEKIIIDDEADYATPNSNVNKKDKESTIINKYVGKLLDENAIYIGVTATPARIDLNNVYENNNQKWIHFPPHDAYTGQDDFFPIKLELVKYSLNFLSEEGDNSKDIRDAFFSFMVNVAYLNTIDSNDERGFSMLIHTSGKIDEQHGDRLIIEKISQGLRDQESSDFERYIQKISDIATKRYPDSVDDILGYILHNTGNISPIVMNNKSKDDPEPAVNPASPFTVVIGGNIISRGVTFNNLLSMFFTRNVKNKMQQDTYIQRARMFGARGNILKYFELHIPKNLYEDWHKCFIFHRLSWEAIKNGEAPVWLADKKVSPTSGSSIKKSILSIDSGEIAFNLFDYTKSIDTIFNSDLNAFEKIISLKEKVKDSIPPYFISFLEKFSNYKSSVFVHSPLDVSNQKDTNVENIVRKKGLFGGTEIKKNNQFDHHFRIFFNNQNKARLVYKNIGRISFLRINRK